MSVINSIKMPAPGAPLADFEAVANQLNTVLVTADQVERGRQECLMASSDRSGLAVLTAFARAEGFDQPELAAQALRIRIGQLWDALSDGVDIQVEVPDLYEAITVGPIYPGDLGYYPTVGEDDLTH